MQFRLIIVLFLVACSPAKEADARDPALAGFFAAPIKIISGEREHDLIAYLAVTEQQKTHGLMFVRDLPVDHGMLFLYQQPRILSMWMKNTYLPLDMLFIRSDGTIDSIAADTTPHSLNSISAKNPVTAVLELNAGTVAKLKIKSGDRVLYQAFQR